jgi:DeoR/GlpR family transcriptional regulator of sugar metabolism
MFVLNERRERIKDYIYQNGDVKVSKLIEIFPEVTPMTIRRDLTYLEEQKVILRSHGSARKPDFLSPLSEDLYINRESINSSSKDIIAQKAEAFVEERRSLFLDSGTTIMSLVKRIPDHKLTIFTTGPNIGMEIARTTTKPQITLLGGNLSRNTFSTSGYSCLDAIHSINIDVAFIVPSAYSLNFGFSVGNQYECEVKRAILKKAQTRILLIDSSKFDKNMPYTFATMADIDYFISDDKVPTEIQEEAAQHHVTIL